MNGRFPSITATKAIDALKRAGFVVVRTSGSHHRLVHKDDPSRATTVPVHKGKDLPRGLVRKIIRDSGLTVEEFRALL